MDLQRVPPRIAPAERRERLAHKSLIPWRRSRTILLVENEMRTRRMLAGVMRRDGHKVVEVSNGDDALDWLGPGVVDGDLDHIPDLVVSDVHLPYFSGLEILELLQVPTRRIPVILITSLPNPETHVQASRLGARCLLEEPFDVGELRAAIHLALRARCTESPGLDNG